MKLKIMHFNILHGGEDLYDSLDPVISIIKATEADIISLIEANGSEERIAKALNFFFYRLPLCHRENNQIAILSRYPIIKTMEVGVQVQLADEQVIALFAAQLVPDPYEPYEFRDNEKYNVETCIASAKRRISLIQDISVHFDGLGDKEIPIVLSLDSNEPSHLDWTSKAKHLHLQKSVEWPTSKYLYDLGMRDAFRLMHQDEVAKPGVTWTTLTEVPQKFTEAEFLQKRIASGDAMPAGDNEVHDRLDFLYFKGLNIKLEDAIIIGEEASGSDLTFTQWPSDHRAVMATFDVR